VDVVSACVDIRPSPKTDVLVDAIITHANDRRAGRVFSPVVFMCLFVCLSVCLFFHMISQKPLQLGVPNLTLRWSTMSLGNPFILGSKGQRPGHEAQKILPAWVVALL